MKRLLQLGLCLFAFSCDNGAIVLNGAPSVTAIGPVTREPDGLHVYVWIRDHERNGADLSLRVVSGSTATPVTKAGGHGLVGLTTSRDPSGEPHLLILDAAGLPASLRLRAAATDPEGGEGPTFETAEFTLTGGLPTP